MMDRNEFFDYVKENIRDYLPADYQGAQVDLITKAKNNDLILTGVLIRKEEERMSPNIYLDGYYEEYQNGQISVEGIMENVAATRVEHNDQELGFDVDSLMDYGYVKDKLQIRLCDPEKNEERLKNVVFTMQGDFAAVYYINLFENEEEIGGAAVTPQIFAEWDIPIEQLHADALAADADMGRKPILSKIDDMMTSLLFGEEPRNLLDEQETADLGMNVQTENTAEFQMQEVPMYCLTNQDRMNGASLVVNEELMKSVGKAIGSDFYVLPSSIHETLLVPVSAQMELSVLQEMVRSVNETEVSQEDLLSDKVQYYDREACILENAQARQERMEKEKSAERVSDPKSVLGLLAEKKEQSKTAERNSGQRTKLTPELAM